MPQRRHDPTLYDLHAGFNLGFIAGLIRPRGQHAHAVVHGQFVIRAVQIRLVAAGPIHSRAGIIRDDQFGNTAEEFEGTNVGADPVLQFLARGGFGVSVVAGPQDSDEDRGRPLRPAVRIMDGNRRTGVIDEELLSRRMLLAQHHI